MARINLLPWRQAERERKNREFMTLLVGVLLLSLLTAFAGWSYFNSILDSQKQANEKIKQENTKLDTALKEIDSLEKQRNDMLAQMKVIQDLQGRRPIPVRVWDDIVRMIPAQLYLTNMKRVGDTITFTGRADNANVVSEFIRNLDTSEWLENSAVKSINQPKTVAYNDVTKSPVAPQNPTNNANGTNTPPRPIYPEDNYVIFTVTTNIAKALSPDSATAGTVVSATSSTTVKSVNHATSGVGATNTTIPTAQPAVSANAPIVMGPESVGHVVSSSATKTTTTTTTTTKNTVSNEVLKPVTSTNNPQTGTPPVSTVPTTNKENK